MFAVHQNDGSKKKREKGFFVCFDPLNLNRTKTHSQRLGMISQQLRKLERRHTEKSKSKLNKRKMLGVEKKQKKEKIFKYATNTNCYACQKK